MAEVISDRLQKLLAMLAKEPNDTFLLYGVGMEYKKADDFPRALEYLRKVVQLDPGYCYAYHQQGLIHESTGDIESAKAAYRDGITAAMKKSDAHAQAEIEAALAMIE